MTADCPGCGHPQALCACSALNWTNTSDINHLKPSYINYLKVDDQTAPAHLYAKGSHTGINLRPRANNALTFSFSGGSITFRKDDQDRIDVVCDPPVLTAGAQEFFDYLRRMLNVPQDGDWEWTVEVDGENLYTQYETRQEAADRMAVLAADDPERVMRLMRRYTTDWKGDDE